ncbi:G-protein coupled receptor 20 isoform X2 [Physeter macrocephalus]|uniref:G-protein coupled receptor 20 isoform X2 n=1 Tax=Physeter macrocephalus TaxID=9755 RepID=A0A455ATU5_PHYMC|nr:G-protein coupled receptor 20 isoform X2 [Physeter catodon]XP_028339559.1 G-protein coupled receptor 20 isoform X2 [Physeter catodon]|eukprot:XP_028339558.1 G-protein coupled receptor 20 isoform X2 [Physeter catodon]
MLGHNVAPGRSTASGMRVPLRGHIHPRDTHEGTQTETQTTHVRDLGHGPPHPGPEQANGTGEQRGNPDLHGAAGMARGSPGCLCPLPGRKPTCVCPRLLQHTLSASRALQGPGSLPTEDAVGDRVPGWSRCAPSPSRVVQLRLCPPCLSFLLCLAGPADSAAPGSLPQGPEPRSSGGRRGRGRRPPRPHPAPAPTPPLPLPKRSPERGPDVSPQEGEVRREAGVSGPQSRSRGRLLSTRAKLRAKPREAAPGTPTARGSWSGCRSPAQGGVNRAPHQLLQP